MWPLLLHLASCYQHTPHYSSYNLLNFDVGKKILLDIPIAIVTKLFYKGGCSFEFLKVFAFSIHVSGISNSSGEDPAHCRFVSSANTDACVKFRQLGKPFMYTEISMVLG